MYYDEESGLWKPFGTSPVTDAYLVMREQEDNLIREMLISSATEIKEVPPEEDIGIWMDLSGPEPVFSKGFIDFFKKWAHVNNSDFRSDS
jgi:hypothetical protein